MEKGNAFLVDTKTICFMCFQEKQEKAEVKADPVVPIKNNVKVEGIAQTTSLNNNNNDIKINSLSHTDKKELNKIGLSSGSSCTKAEVKVDVNKKSPPQSTSFSFRLLARYLEINLQKVFSLNVPFHSRHLLDKTELSVSLCSRCGPVVNSFVKLCQELELIQMRIQGCVKKVHQVISQADNDKLLVDNYRKLMVTPNPLDLIQAGIVDNLRKEILDKCTLKSRTAYPRVRLEKYKVTSSAKSRSLVPKIVIPKLDLTAILTEETYLESIRRSASVIFTSAMKSQAHHHLPNPVPSPMNGNLNLQLETVLAPTSGPGSLENMEVFNGICEEIEIQSTPTTNTSSMPCANGTVLDPLRDMEYTDTEPISFPVEDESLALEKVSSPPTQHEQEVEVEELENDCDDYVKLCKRIVKGQPRFFCEQCNQRVTSRQKHKRVVHREGLLRCTYCGKGFSEYRERKLHTTIQHHFEKHLLPLKPPSMSEGAYKEITEACFNIVTENRKDHSCPLCNKSHRKSNNLRGHLLELHFDVYKAKLDQLLGQALNPNQIQNVHMAHENNAMMEDSSSGMEVITVVERPIEILNSNPDQNQSLLNDLEFSMNSSQLDSSISEEGSQSQSPALSQQQSVQMEVDKEEEDNTSEGDKSKYIVITGRKADGRPMYYCNRCKKTVTNTIMHKRIHHGEKLLRCEHCDKEVTTAYILREHTAQFHPIQLFKSLQSKNCSDEQFIGYVDLLMSDLIKKSNEVKNPGERQKCPLCLKECKQKGRWYLHVTEHHFQELTTRLQNILAEHEHEHVAINEDEDKIQQVILVQIPANNTFTTMNTTTTTTTGNPSPSKQIQTPTLPIKSSSSSSEKKSNCKGNYSEKHRFICDACGSRFTQSSSLKRHEKLYCKVVKSQDSSISSNSTVSEVECHPLLTPMVPSQSQTLTVVALVPTTIPQEVQAPTTSLKTTTIPMTTMNSMSMSISTTSNMGTTSASCSSKKMESIPLPSSSSLAEGLSTIDTSSLNWSIGTSTPGGGNLGCSYCDKTFMFPYCQRTHLITSHRVETFSEHVPIGTSYEEVETVLTIILQDFNKTPSGMNICNFCPKEYAQVAELESHVLISHFDDVVVKLKNLVQLREELIVNPNFGASFDNFNLLSEDCVIDGSEELVGIEGDTGGSAADVQIFDLDQFPELKEIYTSLSGAGTSGTGGETTQAVDISGVGVTGHSDQDGIGLGIEQVINTGNASDISMGDQLFF